MSQRNKYPCKPSIGFVAAEDHWTITCAQHCFQRRRPTWNDCYRELLRHQLGETPSYFDQPLASIHKWWNKLS